MTLTSDIPAGGSGHTQHHRDVAAIIDPATATAGQVLTADGAGSASYEDPTGGGGSLTGTAGGVGEAGGDVTLLGGTGDDGNDAGASIEIGAGDGAGNAGYITLTTGGLTLSVLGLFTTNPQDGLAADDGSLAVRSVGGAYELWQKVNSDDTGWQRFAAAEGAPGVTGNEGADVFIAGGTGDAGATTGAAITLQGGQVGAEGTIGLYSGGLEFSVIGGTADPSAGGGVAADVASLYARDNSGTGELWVKTGASDTAWTQVI